jgi:hypothetical protein
VNRTAAIYLVTLYNFLFPTRRLLQIIVILTATLVMKWLSNGHDFSWLPFAGS